MKIALLGAGFSKNWGGWLAEEVRNQLLGKLLAFPELRQQLIARRNFEEVLGTVQQQARQGQPSALVQLQALELAIGSVFHRMNVTFANLPDLDFPSTPNFAERSVHKFLARFDAIFTLNQDLLLECHYSPELRQDNWQGWYQPGIAIPHNWRNGPAADRATQILHLGPYETCDGVQPIYKLHGSVNWRSTDGQPMMIVGAGKSAAIEGNKLLSKYLDAFKEYLEAGNTRLMAIGYSFSDDHIDQAILSASGTGLRLYVVNPGGLTVLDKLPQGAIGYSPGQLTSLVTGCATRTLKETFTGDDLQRQALEEFLED